ncbi:MAG: fumarylacetoacetase [Phycisphaerales bacterium]|nr:fumarylacetoacetase [Phycisphaerales bacterium]
METLVIDRARRSFVEVAPSSHFPLQNLPYGVFRRADHSDPRPGVRIGDFVLDLRVAEERGLLADASLSRGIFASSSLNAFMALGRQNWVAARRVIADLLDARTATLRDDSSLRAAALLPVDRVTMCLPCEIGDYTDFYSSREHATNVGMMFRGKENALMPNWLWLPVGYHGRSSSIVISGTPIKRPKGQSMADGAERPVFGPSRTLDIELEVGALIGPGNSLGAPLSVDRAMEHVFGLVLVNDWSARDIQKWEYVPLGPFLGKNFATTVSPWVVTLDALEPFRCPAPQQEPAPLEYLRPAAGSDGGFTYDIPLAVTLAPAATTQVSPGSKSMDRPAEPLNAASGTFVENSAATICRSNFKYLYWTIAQQIAHHTCNGCNLRPGDLLASGTISGPSPDSFGSLLELTWRGERPLRLPGGVERKFLQDGDTITLTGCCETAGLRVGFGECSGTIRPAN